MTELTQVYKDEKTQHELFVGNFLAFQDDALLMQHKIKTCITCLQATAATLEMKKTMKHLIVPVNDLEQENIYQYLDSTADAILQGLLLGNVLVHWYVAFAYCNCFYQVKLAFRGHHLFVWHFL